MHRRVVDLERRFVAAIMDIVLFLLERIVSGDINTKMIKFRDPVSHPVGDQFSGARSILHPDRYRVPQAAYLG